MKSPSCDLRPAHEPRNLPLGSIVQTISFDCVTVQNNPGIEKSYMHAGKSAQRPGIPIQVHSIDPGIRTWDLGLVKRTLSPGCGTDDLVV